VNKKGGARKLKPAPFVGWGAALNSKQYSEILTSENKLGKFAR